MDRLIALRSVELEVPGGKSSWTVIPAGDFYLEVGLMELKKLSEDADAEEYLEIVYTMLHSFLKKFKRRVSSSEININYVSSHFIFYVFFLGCVDCLRESTNII